MIEKLKKIYERFSNSLVGKKAKSFFGSVFSKKDKNLDKEEEIIRRSNSMQSSSNRPSLEDSEEGSMNTSPVKTEKKNILVSKDFSKQEYSVYYNMSEKVNLFLDTYRGYNFETSKKYLDERFSSIKTIEGIDKFIEKIEKELEKQNDNYVLNTQLRKFYEFIIEKKNEILDSEPGFKEIKNDIKLLNEESESLELRFIDKACLSILKYWGFFMAFNCFKSLEKLELGEFKKSYSNLLDDIKKEINGDVINDKKITYIHMLDGSLVFLNKFSTYLKNTKEQIEKYEQNNLSLSNEIEILRQEDEKKSGTIENKKEELSILESDYEVKTNELNEFWSENKVLIEMSENDLFKKILEQIESKEEVQKEFDLINKDKDSIEKKLNAKEKEIIALNEKISNSKNEIPNMENLANEKMKAIPKIMSQIPKKSKIDEIREKIKEFDSQIKNAEYESKKSSDEIEKLQKSEGNSDSILLAQQMDIYNDHQDQLNELVMARSKLVKQLKNLEQTKEQCTKEAKEIDTERTKIHAKIKEEEKMIKELGEKLENTENDITYYKKKIDSCVEKSNKCKANINKYEEEIKKAKLSIYNKYKDSIEKLDKNTIFKKIFDAFNSEKVSREFHEKISEVIEKHKNLVELNNSLKAKCDEKKKEIDEFKKDSIVNSRELEEQISRKEKEIENNKNEILLLESVSGSKDSLLESVKSVRIKMKAIIDKFDQSRESIINRAEYPILIEKGIIRKIADFEHHIEGPIFRYKKKNGIFEAKHSL